MLLLMELGVLFGVLLMLMLVMLMLLLIMLLLTMMTNWKTRMMMQMR